MRKHKRICFLCLLPVFLLIFGGCSSEKEKPKEDKAGYRIYYINKDETAVVTELYAPKGDTTGALLEEFLVCLRESSGEREEKPAIPEDVVLLDYTLDKGQLSLQFNLAYLDMNPLYEILCRSAIVRTLCQIPEVETVSFMVGDSPLMDSNEIPIGALNEESFVENAGDEINTYTKTTLTLYFANEKGDRLLEESVSVRYNSNISTERLIMDQLIKGPAIAGLNPVIPPETKVIGVSVKDTVCYVNLDEGFLNNTYVTDPRLTIYAIVNSIVDGGACSQVQISVNGESKMEYMGSVDLSKPLSRDQDFVENVKESEK